jgi:hypothetical protein
VVATHPDPVPALRALSELRERLCDALLDGYPPDGPELVVGLNMVHDLALWCRDAGLAYVRTGCTWGEIAEATQISDATLQSRWRKFYERGGVGECG